MSTPDEQPEPQADAAEEEQANDESATREDQAANMDYEGDTPN